MMCVAADFQSVKYWFRAERCRLRLKCDGTRAETRFRLSVKQTSPFKSAGASVQSTTGSRGVRISGSNVGYTMFRGSEGYWLPTPFASFPFTSPPIRQFVPLVFNSTLQKHTNRHKTLHKTSSCNASDFASIGNIQGVPGGMDKTSGECFLC